MQHKTLAALMAALALHGAAFAQATIKLGVINIDAGPLAAFSMAVNEGATMAVETLNARGGALGRKYELVTQSHDGSPAAAIAAANRLVNQSGVSFFTGLSPTGNSLAVAAKLGDLNALFIDSTSQSDDLIGKSCTPNYFHVSITDGSQAHVWRDLAQRSGAKSFDFMMADMAAAHNAQKQVAAFLPALDATVNRTLYTPFATTDHGSSIAQLLAKPAEALVLYMPGSAGVTFSKQQAQFGLFDKYKLVVSTALVNEILVGGQGDTTAGVYSTQGYFFTMPGGLNAEFVKAFEARFNHKPSYMAADNYLAMMLIHEAILKAKSTDTAAVRTALSGLKMDSIVGVVEMRAADHQLVRPQVVVQAVKVAPGKSEIVLRSTEPAARATLPPNPECKLG